jgi:hypothetical protein
VCTGCGGYTFSVYWNQNLQEKKTRQKGALKTFTSTRARSLVANTNNPSHKPIVAMDLAAAMEPGGDYKLDDLVRALSAQVNATDGAWVRDNTGEGPSIFQDFEAALQAAPRMAPPAANSGGDAPAAASAAATMAAMLSALSAGGGLGGSSGARVIDLADLMGGGGDTIDLSELDLGQAGGDAAAGLQEASDQLAEMMLALSSKSSSSKDKGGGGGGSDEAGIGGGGDDALKASLAGMGLSLVGVESSAGDGEDALKGLLAQLSTQLKAEKSAGTKGSAGGTGVTGAAAPSTDSLAALGFEVVSVEPGVAGIGGGGGGGGGGDDDGELKGLLTQLSSQLSAEKAAGGAKAGAKAN